MTTTTHGQLLTRPRNTESKRDRLTATLHDIADTYGLLALYAARGSRPGAEEVGTVQRLRISQSPAHDDVLDLLDEREKPGGQATRLVGGEWSSQGWQERPDWSAQDLDKLSGRRQGVLPTLLQWARGVDADQVDAGDPHPPLYPPGAGFEIVGGPLDGRRSQPDWPRLTVRHVSGWLIGQLPWIVEQQWLGQFDSDVALLLADMRRAAGIPPEERARLICKRCGDKVVEVTTEPSSKNPDPPNYFRCLGCRISRSWLELYRIAEHNRPKKAKAIANLLGISERTIATYRAEKLIKPRGRDGNADLFFVDDVAGVIKLQGRDITGKYRRPV